MAAERKDPVEEREDSIEALLLLFLLAQRRIVALVARYPAAGMTRRRLTAALGELDAITANLRAEVSNWLEVAVLPSYQSAADFTQERAQADGNRRIPGAWGDARQQAVEAISADMADDMARTVEAMNIEVSRYFRRSSADELARKAALKALQEANRRRRKAEIADQALEEMRDRIINGEYVQAGARRMKVDDYIEMVARTRLQEAITQATLLTALSYGLDLVMVGIRNACPTICTPFIGKVYSITGESPDFPKLNERPPYHPNCMCYLIPVSAAGLKSKLGRGYNRLVDYSNRKDGVQPEREFYERAVGKDHLDASDRELVTIRQRQEKRKAQQ